MRKGSRKIATLGVGQYFGELSLMDQKPHAADVVTTSPTTLGVLSSWEFAGFAKSNPEVHEAMLKEEARRLRDTDDTLPP